MSKKTELAGLKQKDKVVRADYKQYHEIAKKIVEGLLETGSIKEFPIQTNDCESRVNFPPVPPLKGRFVEAIASAMKNNLTYGNLGTMTLRNNRGQIVAKLYMLPDGTLATDSWVRNQGWKH